jgi:flavin reductase (DIM6/NTAB) family NADH-FMN oxidoreductase RutF
LCFDSESDAHARLHQERLPTDNVRRFLEPGPIILVSSAHKGERNIMTMGWHMIMGFSPSPPRPS